MNDPNDRPRTLTLGDIALWIADARECGAADDTPIFAATGNPGAELLLLPVGGATNWPVRFYMGGGAATVPTGQNDPTATPAVVFLLNYAGQYPGKNGAVGFRFGDTPETLYLVGAGEAAAFQRSQAQTFRRELFGPPVPFTSYLDVTMYIARDEADPTTPEVTSVCLTLGDRSETYVLSKNAAALRGTMQDIRRLAAAWFDKP